MLPAGRPDAPASRRRSAAIADLLLPGSGLLAEGRTVAGAAVAAAALVAGLTAAGAGILAPDQPTGLRVLGGAGWLGLVLALAAWRWWTRPRPLDETAVRAAHRACAEAYLAGRFAAAQAHAEHLCRLAAHEPGAWRLRALVTAAAGQDGERFRRRAERLEALA